MGAAMGDVSIGEIVTRPPFSTLYKISEDIYKEVVSDMQVRGYNPENPVVLWKFNGESVMVDGHTRLKAAIACGEETIWALFKDFKDESEAMAYAIKAQKNRRNMSAADLRRAVKEFYKPMSKSSNLKVGIMRPEASIDASGNPPTAHRKTSEALAEVLGTSSATVERILVINTDEDVSSKVDSGEMSITAGANEVKRKRGRPAGSKNKPKGEVKEEVKQKLEELNGRQQYTQADLLVEDVVRILYRIPLNDPHIEQAMDVVVNMVDQIRKGTRK